jgi:3-dehydroquinate synthase
MPTRLPAIDDGWQVDKLMAHFAHDKKVDQGRLTFILARGIGKCFVSQDVPEDKLRALLTDWSAEAVQ